MSWERFAIKISTDITDQIKLGTLNAVKNKICAESFLPKKMDDGKAYMMHACHRSFPHNTRLLLKSRDKGESNEKL